MVEAATVAKATGVTLLVPGLLLLLSIGCVEQNEYGLVFNWVTKDVKPQVFHGGTHFIGFWNKFIRFPATVQTIEFSDRLQHSGEALHTRTKEGLGLHLSISFQYRLNQTMIPELFSLTNVQYEGLFTRIARDEVLEAASQYEGPQYWLMRREIGEHMKRLVHEKFQETCAQLWGMQLLVIDLPDRYEKSITLTQVQEQIIQTRLNQQVAAGIRADTEVIRAQFGRDIAVVQAGAQANFTRVTKLARAEAERRKIQAEASALGYVRKKLGLSAEAAVKYQQLASFGSMPNASFLANLPAAVPVVSVGGGAAAAVAAPQGLLQRRGVAAQERPAEKPPASAPEDDAQTAPASEQPPAPDGESVEKVASSLFETASQEAAIPAPQSDSLLPSAFFLQRSGS